jgi:hypothetical protein
MRLILILILTSALIGGFAAEESRLAEAKGGFSYLPPIGWTIKEIPGMKYRFSVDQPANQFAANINVVDEEFAGDLDAYVKANLAGLAKFYQKMEVAAQAEFITTNGAKAHRVVVNGTINNRDLRQVFFLFTGTGTRKYVMTCSALAADADQRDALFDAAAKSFQLTAAAPVP